VAGLDEGKGHLIDEKRKEGLQSTKKGQSESFLTEEGRFQERAAKDWGKISVKGVWVVAQERENRMKEGGVKICEEKK